MDTPLFRPAIIALLIAAIFLPRLISLGTILTVDEPLWQGRGGQFIRGVAVGQFEKTLVAGQPGVTTAWLAGVTHRFHSLAISQAAIAIATGFLILLCSYLLNRLWGWPWGIVAGFMLALDPFLLGHSRVVHTDALLALFYLASILSLLVGLIQEPTTRRYIVYSGILGGLALLTKVFALVLLPTIGLLFLWGRYRGYISTSILIRRLPLWIGICAVTVYVLWPALWFHSETVFDYVRGRGELHTEGTRAEETTSAPWYYVREIIFRLNPFVMLLTAGGIIAMWQRVKSSSNQIAFIILSTGLLYAIALSFGSDKSDRYVLFTVLALDCFAVMGLKTLIEVAKQRWSALRNAAPLVITAVITVLLIDVVRLHPYYLAHYNRLYPIETTHKLGWGEGLELAANWIQENSPQANVATYYPRVFQYFAPALSVNSITHHEQADYVVLYRAMFERGEGTPETDLMHEFVLSGKKPVRTFTINGLPYVWIFPTNQP